VQGGNPVEFPGQKKRQRFRMRGIKKASSGVQKRLRRNLDILLEDPHSTLPDVTGPTRRGLSRDRMKGALNEIEKVLRKRENHSWLQKRMARQGGDAIAKAYAGSLLAAHEDDISTVSVFKDDLYGSASFMQRGKGARLNMVGIQNHSNSKLRLLTWMEMAKRGYWFFSWSKGFVCTGIEPAPPVEWLAEALRGTHVDFTEPKDEGGLWMSKGLNADAVGSVGTDHLLLKFNNGTEVAIALSDLRSLKDSFVISAATMMVPTSVGPLVEVEVYCAPEGFGGDIPDAASEAMTAVVDRWLDMKLEDAALAANIHGAFASQLTDGFLIGRRYFPADAGAEFIEELQGGLLEKEAVTALLDVLEDGIRVDSDGEGHTLASPVVWLETGTANSLLTATWNEYGLDLLESLFDMTGDDAERVHSKQARSGRAFGNFLRRLDEQQSGVRKQRKFPWRDGVLPTPLDFANQLVKRGRIDGLGPTTSMARKAGSDVDLAMGWAWLVVHGKGEGEAWHFEPDTRDKGGDWAPPLERLWNAAEQLLEDDGGTSGYIEAMEGLRRATGTIAELPE